MINFGYDYASRITSVTDTGTTAAAQNPGSLGTFKYNLRFPGQYYQAETGLNQNYFRDYDPRPGRYIESDSIGLGSGSVSTYAYVGGNPASYRDELGQYGGDPSALQNVPAGVSAGCVNL